MKLIKIKSFALILALASVYPSSAWACRWYDVKCKAREAYNKAQNAVNKAAAEAKAAADRAKAESERAAREAAAQSERLAGEAAAEAERLAREAAELAERLAREELDRLLDAAFRDLKRANLDELAQVSKIGDGDFWTKTIVNTVVKNITDLDVVEQAESTASELSHGLGTPSEQHPFGDGPYALAIEHAMKTILDQAVKGAEGELAALNPLKNPNLKADPTAHAKVFSDYFQMQLPSPLQFKYEVGLQAKPLTVTWTNFEYDEAGRHQLYDTKVGFAIKVPLINGDWNKETTILSNAVKNKQFIFQVSMFIASTNTKLQQKAFFNSEIKQEDQFAFDIACSTQNIGTCQLQKMGMKVKNSVTHEAADSNPTEVMVSGINSVLSLIEHPIALTVLFGSNSSKKADFKESVEDAKGFVTGAFKVLTVVEPPTQAAAANGFALMDSVGLYGPLAALSKSTGKLADGVLGGSQLSGSFLGPMAMIAPGLNSYKQGGSTYWDTGVQTDEDGKPKYKSEDIGPDGKPKKDAKPLKTKGDSNGNWSKAGYTEKTALDITVGIQWLNDDYMNGTFRSGFTPTQRTRQQGTPQILTLELGKSASSEFKIGTTPSDDKVTKMQDKEHEKRGTTRPNGEDGKPIKISDDDFEIAFTASLDSRASFGITVPFHKEAARWLRAQGIDTISLSDFELDELRRQVGSDPYNIGASKTWIDPVDPSVLPTVVEAGATNDALALPAFVALLPR